MRSSIGALRVVVALAAGSCLFLTACEAALAPPTRFPDFDGRIVSVKEVGILVEGASVAYPGRFVTAHLRWSDRANVFRRQNDGSHASASIDELQAGQRVHAWVEGDWMESDPLQADADTLVILPNIGGEGDAAVWDIDQRRSPVGSSQTFTALVTRLGCSSGVTGAVLDPDVLVKLTEIIVTFEVEALSPADHTCPGNDEVPYTVDVGEPIGDRVLIDGACLSGGAAASLCSDGGLRWRP